MEKFTMGPIITRPMTEEERAYHESGEWKKNTPLIKWKQGMDFDKALEAVRKDDIKD